MKIQKVMYVIMGSSPEVVFSPLWCNFSRKYTHITPSSLERISDLTLNPKSKTKILDISMGLVSVRMVN